MPSSRSGSIVAIYPLCVTVFTVCHPVRVNNSPISRTAYRFGSFCGWSTSSRPTGSFRFPIGEGTNNTCRLNSSILLSRYPSYPTCANFSRGRCVSLRLAHGDPQHLGHFFILTLKAEPVPGECGKGESYHVMRSHRGIFLLRFKDWNKKGHLQLHSMGCPL